MHSPFFLWPAATFYNSAGTTPSPSVTFRHLSYGIFYPGAVQAARGCQHRQKYHHSLDIDKQTPRHYMLTRPMPKPYNRQINL